MPQELTAKEWHYLVGKVDEVLSMIPDNSIYNRLTMVGKNFQVEVTKCFQKAAAEELQKQWNS